MVTLPEVVPVVDHQGVIPRRHDPDDTQRLVLHACRAELHMNGHMALLRAHHAAQVQSIPLMVLPSSMMLVS